MTKQDLREARQLIYDKIREVMDWTDEEVRAYVAAQHKTVKILKHASVNVMRRFVMQNWVETALPDPWCE